jgi:hypothetical protein
MKNYFDLIKLWIRKRRIIIQQCLRPIRIEKWIDLSEKPDVRGSGFFYYRGRGVDRYWQVAER